MNAQLPPPSTLATSRRLADKLATVRRKEFRVEMGTGLCRLLAGWTVVLAVLMLLDWWLDFPWPLRVAFLTLQVLALGYGFYHWIGRRLWHRPSEEETALLVERALPQFRTRLIASVQLPKAAPGPQTEAFVRALVRETEALAAPIEFTQVIQTRTLARTAFFAIIIALLALTWFTQKQGVAEVLLRRSFLSKQPVPRKTRIVWTTGPTSVGRGDALTLEARVEGVIPKTGKILIDYDSGLSQELTLTNGVGAAAAHFAGSMDNVPESFDYIVQINDGRTRSQHVEVIPRPAVKEIKAEQQFPDYTRLGSTPRSASDLTLLIGSKLKLHISASDPIKSARLQLHGINKQLVLQVDPQHPTELTGEFQVMQTNLTGFSVQLLGISGMESKGGAVYTIDVLPDKAPLLRLTAPERKEETVTRLATLLVGFEVEDDFGVESVALHYKVEGQGAAKTVPLQLEPSAPRQVRHRFDWKLGELVPALREGALVEFWIRAVDNNHVTGQSSGESEHFTARVVSAEKKRLDLLQRAGEYLDSLNEVATDQEKLNDHLGTYIKAKTQP